MTSESAFSLCTGYGSVKADQVPRLPYIVAIRLLLAGYQHLHALVYIPSHPNTSSVLFPCV